MKFSLFFEMQLSSPTDGREQDIFHDSVKQAVLADQLGYHAIWAVEHHGLREYAHSSAPEVFLSFVAARTSNVRIGHGVSLTTHRYNHPIRVAERVATLDILSNGRVNWGSGKSGTRTEQQAFECDIPALSDEWLEAQRMIPRMWQDDVFEWRGKFFDIPPTQIVPKPVQKPQPPMFAACSTPSSAREAGALGLGALNFSAGTQQKLTQRVRQYRDAVAGADPIGGSVTDHYACTPMSLVLEDDREACEYGFRGARFFSQSQMKYYGSEDRPLGDLGLDTGPLPEEELERAMAARHDPGAPLTDVIGSPEVCRRRVEQFQQAGVDELILVMQMGTVPHDIVMESIRTFGEQVLPYFADHS
ncbi:LLM class flavin-dependent oxidoreductase [Streptomyces sp. CRN 30]|uniref:LLM class flavin-dependent oxidoreductase n=1 Tax=Streptomyces sp. CRN 30 TaxID=3075613 RepID=UPI002A7FFDAC|nr:LLM class flavin-dependent oxidoreductase [Streptomyces sp. CRN 30]